MRVLKKIVSVALAAAVMGGAGIALPAVSNVDMGVITASAAFSYSITMGVGQTKMVRDITYVPNATYSCWGNGITVDSTGKITATRQGGGVVVVKVSGKEVGRINVNVNQAPSNVSLNKTSAAIERGTSFTLIPSSSALPKDFVSSVVTWSSSNKNVATVTSKGVVRGVKSGTATITVKTYNGKTATCKVTVKASAKEYSAAMGVGQTKMVKSIVSVSNATYSVSNGCVRVDSTGKITAVSQGSGTITVRTSGKIAAYIDITVQKAPTNVSLNKTTATIEKGKSFTLTPSSTGLSQSFVSSIVTWSSSNKSVATVTSKGVVKGVKNGTATITVKTYNGKTATCKVTVKLSQHDSYVDEVIKLVNAERAKKGIAPVVKDNTLCKLADTRACEISPKDANGKDYFAHKRRDGRDWYTILDDNGYDYLTGGENIAAGYATPEKVVAGWVKSPGHYANIMNPDYTKIGIGYYYISDDAYGYYWTQLFAG